MTTPALFIGVVSYKGSRFALSQGPNGLAAQLHRVLEEGGLTVAVQVTTEDRHDPHSIKVTPSVIRDSLTAQQQLEDAWMAYVQEGRGRTLREAHKSVLRWGRRQLRRVRPPGPGPVTRLINIELSHVELLRAGVRSDAPWILVVEDDGATLDLDDCAEGLRGIMAEAPAAVSFVNVSESFTLEELGITSLLTDSGAVWSGSVPRRVLAARRPVTNTVCAILYRREFVNELLRWFDAQSMTPVVPIDWKLNRALMDMHARGLLGPGSCWLISPAPIDQLSMREGTTS